MAEGDQSREDGTSDGHGFDDAFLNPGPRRSTYTPPPNRVVPSKAAEQSEQSEPSGSTEPALPDESTQADAESAPADAPSTAPRIPERRSLTDDELAQAAISAPSTLDALEEVERQLRLRAEEAKEYQEWERSMLAVGTPDAVAAVEQARPQFEQVVTSAIAIQQPVPVEPEPEPEIDDEVDAFDEIASDEITSEPDAVDPAPPPLVEPPESGSRRFRARWAAARAEAPADPSPPVAGTDDASDRTVEDAQPLPPQEASTDDVEPLANREDPADAEPAADVVDPFALASIPSAPEALADFAEPAEPGAEPETVLPPARGAVGPEDIGVLPTPAEQRVGRAVRSFWLWFATNASIVSVAVGAVMFSLGLSLRQVVIATLAGVLISFIPLGLGTLAGKRSGQPTMVVSRATFGVHGNILPVVVAIVSRVFWGAALLWLLGSSISSVLDGANASGGRSAAQLTIVCMGLGFVVALVLAFFGFRIIAVFQIVVSVVSAVLVIGLIALTWQHVHPSVAVAKGDGPAILLVTGAVLVFSFVGLAWANASGDLARFQKPSGSSVGSSLFAGFGTALPTFALISYGALLAASDPTVATGLVTDPLDTLGRMLPAWYPVPLIVAAALSLLSGVVVSIYSGSFALAATGLRLKQSLVTIIVAVVVFLAAWGISAAGGDLVTLFRDSATTIAVPVAAWVGIFAADMGLRRGRFNTRSLLRAGGIYPAVRWLNLGALVVITAIGWGLTTATIAGLDWQGYIFSATGLSLTSDLAQSDVGVFAALVLGFLVSFLGGLKAVRAQEADDVPE